MRARLNIELYEDNEPKYNMVYDCDVDMFEIQARLIEHDIKSIVYKDKRRENEDTDNS